MELALITALAALLGSLMLGIREKRTGPGCVQLDHETNELLTQVRHEKHHLIIIIPLSRDVTAFPMASRGISVPRKVA